MAGFLINGALTPMNYEAITIDNTAGGIALSASEYITTANAAGSGVGATQRFHAVSAFISVESQPIRWTVDGTAPVATTTGHKATDTDTITLNGIDAITKFRAIRDGGTNATIHVTYFKA